MNELGLREIKEQVNETCLIEDFNFRTRDPGIIKTKNRNGTGLLSQNMARGNIILFKFPQLFYVAEDQSFLHFHNLYQGSTQSVTFSHWLQPYANRKLSTVLLTERIRIDFEWVYACGEGYSYQEEWWEQSVRFLENELLVWTTQSSSLHCCYLLIMVRRTLSTLHSQVWGCLYSELLPYQIWLHIMCQLMFHF